MVILRVTTVGVSSVRLSTSPPLSRTWYWCVWWYGVPPSRGQWKAWNSTLFHSGTNSFSWRLVSFGTVHYHLPHKLL